MKTLTTTQNFFGFYLNEPIVFNDYICILTGKNGSGKTRFLQSILSQVTTLSVNDEEISPQYISLLNIYEANPTFFTYYANPRLNETLTQSLMHHISLFGATDNIPDTLNIFLQSYDAPGGEIEVNFKEIINRAQNIFNKHISKISHDELKLSITAHNEFINGVRQSNSFSLNPGISQLEMNYHQSLRMNKFLKFSKSEGEDVTPIDNEILKKIIGDKSPSEQMSEIINKLFRGKFYIQKPDNKIVDFIYAPQLFLASTREVVSLSNLSSGEKAIFWLALKTFETIYASSSNISKKQKVILLDEPDAHLHPQMIMDFYECLETLHERLGFIFIFSTHSPTTIALSPTTNIYSLLFDNETNNYGATIVTKDAAISQLLEGVSQISINSENARQVYVENENDSAIYERIYTCIRNKSNNINPNISLFFLSSGPKLSVLELEKNIFSIFGKNDERVGLLVSKINGQGSCEQVIGIVDYHLKSGSRTVRGLIDWDNKNRGELNAVSVFAKNKAYSIENIVYDPISIFAYLISNDFKKNDDFLINCEDMHWSEVIDDQEKLQEVYDSIVYKILGRENAKNVTIDYMGGKTLLGDIEYFIPKDNKNGHDFEKKILQCYPELKRLLPNNKGKPLIYYFTVQATIGLLTWRFINKIFEEVFSELQA